MGFSKPRHGAIGPIGRTERLKGIISQHIPPVVVVVVAGLGQTFVCAEKVDDGELRMLMMIMMMMIIIVLLVLIHIWVALKRNVKNIFVFA